MKYDPEIRRRALEHIRRFGPAPTHFRMAELTGPGKTVLELGCATGYVSELLTRNGCIVTGVEIDEEAAKSAETHCHRVIVGDLTDPACLKEIAGTYQVVLCGDIIEHLADPAGLLRNIREWLAPGGQLLVSLPNVAYWRMRWELLTGRFEYTETGLLDYTHLRFFTVYSFRRFAESCGYVVKRRIVNDAGFPGSRLMETIPLVRGGVRRAARGLARLFPNLFVFHAIYVLEPSQGESR